MGPVIADVGNHGRVDGWDKAQALSFENARRSDIAASITELQNLVLSTAGMENFLQELSVPRRSTSCGAPRRTATSSYATLPARS